MKKKIFQKNHTFKKNYFILIFIFFILILYLLFFNRYNDILIINENIENFYKYRKANEKEGLIVSNKDKKVLNFNSKNNNHLEIYEELDYSIQLFSSQDLDKVKSKMDLYLSKNMLKNNEFYIVSLKNSLGVDYLLLYKNFDNRNLANNYCLKYLNFIDNCLVVNVMNMN